MDLKVGDMEPSDGDRPAMAELVMKLRGMGISDRRVLVAIERIARRLFLDARDHADASSDRAFPIECGQAATAPSTVARVVQALDLGPDHKVLEVGTGSGFQTAIMAHLANRVISLDRYRTLIDLAKDRFETLRLDNISLILADGAQGFPRHAPYDRIVVNAAVPTIPGALLDQLMDGGILVAPVGDGAKQQLARFQKNERAFTRTEFGVVRFLGLEAGTAAKL
ncbi:Protein-L-isoaspartate O-methyltransferase [Hartmannibacter diazotrophicus]|uniref:Protein-L-isoaspartate O-methyltransferase n=1 Tax=Hartmannibacter diazotrophicus TaxID=1482074 RepID=A0A2C9D731_9HYPH|nr:protein-L-isoaspartate(D-aspartate) O-methyltransferase [Hartmannibacter diazotrophicus]SON55958.1 Protein-L-isoaspartate O-methyltransferase [Hartmannibacter diazotrophicus]